MKRLFETKHSINTFASTHGQRDKGPVFNENKRGRESDGQLGEPGTKIR